jgi:hypothetical protein
MCISRIIELNHEEVVGLGPAQIPPLHRACSFLSRPRRGSSSVPLRAPELISGRPQSRLQLPFASLNGFVRLDDYSFTDETDLSSARDYSRSGQPGTWLVFAARSVLATAILNPVERIEPWQTREPACSADAPTWPILAPAMTAELDPRGIEISLSFPDGDGGLTAELRADVLTEVRRVPWRRVWLNDVVWINTGAVGGPTIDFAVVAEGALSGIAAVAATELAKRVFQLVRRYFPIMVVRLRGGDGTSVEYSIPPPHEDLDAALDSIPADYEVTVKTELMIRHWRDGRWEVVETSRVAGSAPDLPRPS